MGQELTTRRPRSTSSPPRASSLYLQSTCTPNRVLFATLTCVHCALCAVYRCLLLADKWSNESERSALSRRRVSPCTSSELLVAERAVLEAIDHKVFVATPADFLHSVLDAVPTAGARAVAASGVAQKLCTLAITEYALAQAFPPSLRAASALYLARRLVGISGEGLTWTAALHAASGYSAGDMAACVEKLKALREHVSRDEFLSKLYWEE